MWREPMELAVENVRRRSTSPLGNSARVLGELPRDRDIHVICRSGQRAYLATRILLQNGFKASNISGGMLSLAHNHLFENGPGRGIVSSSTAKRRVLDAAVDSDGLTGSTVCWTAASTSWPKEWLYFTPLQSVILGRSEN